MVVRTNVKCNRQFMIDDDDKSHTITPQRVDVEWGRGGEGAESEEGPESLRWAVGT